MYRHKLRLIIVLFLLVSGIPRSFCQNGLPDVFQQGTLSDQLKYIEEKTRIYENYRAIREDMYRAMSRNSLDSLARAKKQISSLTQKMDGLHVRLDSVGQLLETSNSQLESATTTKNSIRVIGMEVNKAAYNSAMWTLLSGLIFLLVIGYLSFRRNRTITLRTRKDLEELKEEFEAYRQKVRVERERVNLEHFNEIKKLKGTGRR